MSCFLVSQEAEERHRQALWAEEGTNGASFIDDNEQEEGGGMTGNDELQYLPTWRLVLRRVVDHDKFQVRYKRDRLMCQVFISPWGPHYCWGEMLDATKVARLCDVGTILMFPNGAYLYGRGYDLFRPRTSRWLFRSATVKRWR